MRSEGTRRGGRELIPSIIRAAVSGQVLFHYLLRNELY